MAETPLRQQETIWRGSGLRILLAIIAGLAAYFLTIQDIRTELTSKAGAEVVREIDTKLNRLEILQEDYQKERTESRRFRENVIERLARIESILNQPGGKR